MRMAAVSAQQPSMGNCAGRADNIKENTNQEDLLIQEYCISAKISKLLLLSEVSKVAKSLPVQLSETTVKPPQSLLFNCVLRAASHHQESFPAPAAFLAASAPAPSLATPVLEPGCRCFLLQDDLRYGGQVHAIIH